MTSPIDLSQFDGATPGQWIETGGSYKRWNPPNIAWDLQQAFAPALVAEVKALRSSLALLLGQLEGVKAKSGVHASSLAADIAIARSLLPK